MAISAPKDANRVPVIIGTSSADGVTPTTIYVDPTTHRVLVDDVTGGTVTSVSVVTANGFAGTVATATTTPAITLTTTITGVLKGNGTAISAATAGSDYAVGSIGLAGGQTIAGSTLTTENLILRANAADLTTGQVNVTSSKEATNTTTASVALAGGLAVAKRVYALDMTVTNTITGSVSGSAGSVAVGGITGLGTGVATALAVNVGSTGAFVTFDGALGTPSSGTVTNLTGTASININGTVSGLTVSSSTGTLTITNAKTFAVTNTLTLSGTDSTVMTFPSTSATIARTDAANTFTGASTASAWVLTAPTITTSIVPTSDDGAPLGDATHNFSDLFLASGALIKFASTNVVLTHTSGILTMTTGDLRVTSANVGTNADSVPTLSSTSTLTNKTLTAPTLGGATSLADGATIKLIVPTADGTASGPTTSAFVSGYTSSAIGDLVILDSSGKWQKTDANTASIYNGLLGIALAVAATDAALLVALPGSFVYATAFPTMTIGAPMYISETAGAITATAPTTTDAATRSIGYAVHADKIFFFPSGIDYTTHI